MKLFLLLAISLALQDLSLAQVPNASSLKQFSEMLMTTPCYTGLELPARDSAAAIRFIEKFTKSPRGIVKPNVFTLQKNTKDYIILSQTKNAEWNLWISVGKHGIRHITEIWKSPNDSLFFKQVHESLTSLIDSWGEPTEENENRTWFKWDKTQLGCGAMSMIYTEEKGMKIVSRRLVLNED